jgi:citrate synthase
MDDWKAGLEDVIAARSGICTIDGEKGQLFYRGYEIGELAGHVSFEDVTWLLWHGELPTPAQSREFAARLEAARPLPAPVRELLERLPHDCHPLDALRTAVSLAASVDADVRSNDADANLRKACRSASAPDRRPSWACAAARTPRGSSRCWTAASPRPRSRG